MSDAKLAPIRHKKTKHKNRKVGIKHVYLDDRLFPFYDGWAT